MYFPLPGLDSRILAGSVFFLIGEARVQICHSIAGSFSTLLSLLDGSDPLMATCCRPVMVILFSRKSTAYKMAQDHLNIKRQLDAKDRSGLIL